MNTSTRLIIGFGLFIVAVLLASEAVVRIYDGEVFDLPNHKLIIMNNDFHFYKKRITVEFVAPSEAKNEI